MSGSDLIPPASSDRETQQTTQQHPAKNHHHPDRPARQIGRAPVMLRGPSIPHQLSRAWRCAVASQTNHIAPLDKSPQLLITRAVQHVRPDSTSRIAFPKPSNQPCAKERYTGRTLDWKATALPARMFLCDSVRDRGPRNPIRSPKIAANLDPRKRTPPTRSNRGHSVSLPQHLLDA